MAKSQRTQGKSVFSAQSDKSSEGARSLVTHQRNHSVFLEAVYGRARFRYGWKKPFCFLRRGMISTFGGFKTLLGKELKEKNKAT
ncbi:hypothetical protein NDI49_21130 [Trichocoleus sp. ST-U3]